MVQMRSNSMFGLKTSTGKLSLPNALMRPTSHKALKTSTSKLPDWEILGKKKMQNSSNRMDYFSGGTQFKASLVVITSMRTI